MATEPAVEQQRAATMAYLRSLGPDGACQLIEKAISDALAQQQPRDVPALIALMCLFDPRRAEHVRQLLVDAASKRGGCSSMRITLDLADDGTSLSVRADRYRPDIDPALLAAGLAHVVETALRELGEPAPVQHDVDVPADAVGVEDLDDEAELTEVQLVAIDEADDEPEVAPAAEPPEPHPDALTEVDLSDHEAVKREALRLLDSGVPASAVAAALHVSTAILRRWDDDAWRDAELDDHAEAVGLG